MKMQINGKAVEACSGEFFDITNPATGELIDRVPRGTGDDVAVLLKLHRQLLAAGLLHLLSREPEFFTGLQRS